MALKKAGTNGATAEAPAPVATAVEADMATGLTQAAVVTPKAAPKQTAPKAKAVDKESYWANKEERDIETGKRIRRSGVWQSANESMAGLQFNQGGTLESYLAIIDQIAEHGLKWVNKD